MTPEGLSIVVVSRGRPQALMRCLTAISQLRFAPFEVVVVADPGGMTLLRQWPLADHVKAVAFDEANISAARNLGIAQAAGGVVAFIDDDAVPEPPWAARIMRAFADATVDVAAGFVKGRNGFSWQWRAQSVDAQGVTRPLEGIGGAVVLTPPPGRAVRTEGTNMAFRRAVLARAGGFDPAYRYFLDETDLNLRLAAAGARTAILPDAVVHHGFAANAQRRADRVPRDLTQIGASWAVFLSRHCPEALRTRRWRDIRAGERARALRHMVSGAIEPRDVRRLMTQLAYGFAEGQARPRSDLAPLGPPEATFLPFPSEPSRPGLALAGRSWQAARLREEARDAVRSGRIVTLTLLSPSALFHTFRFTAAGYWEQTGGLFGRSLRSDPLVRPWSFRARIDRESTLQANLR
ncbi:MAG: glycosyltransferase [Rhodobacteraceae bacterium]|nr:MAG: glycosyltransferase [Paracoccaceae bacterium]